MKSGGPWNLRGLHPETREVARAAARQSGMSVGEWLNSVIRADRSEEPRPPYVADFEGEAERRRRPHFRGGDRGREPHRDAGRRERREEREDQEPPSRYAGRPYHEEHRRDHGDRPRRDRQREEEFKAREEARREEEARRSSLMQEEVRKAARAREELGARLDSLSRQIDRLAHVKTAPPRLALWPRRAPAAAESGADATKPLTGAPQPPPRMPPEASEHQQDLSIEQAVAEIAARQHALESEPSAQAGAVEPLPVTPPASSLPDDHPTPATAPHAASAPPAAIDLSGLELHLRQITARIEALRPTSDIEKAMSALRGDLSEIGRLITEALPRRAVESLEIEVQALAERIDHSRQSGAEAQALAGLERGLADVREVLRGLTTAESLVGMDEAVKALAVKVDEIAAKQDPAALQQLEAAIGALRGVVSHVASSDALTKVAEDVRALSAKVDSLADSAASGHALSALENRIDTLANALNASTEAGHAVPRELEKLLAGLIEKLEWVQLTHTDHAALAHLEDRIAMLVKRLDASDARLSQLAGIERGLADLLVHLEQMRGTSSKNGGAIEKPAVGRIERDVAAIKESERRTQDSLEAVQGTVEHVVDRLAIIETDMRGNKVQAASTSAALPPAPTLAATSPLAPAPMASATAEPDDAAKPAPIESGPHRAVTPQRPIDPNLPPDHPLEPGSASARSRPSPSAADRIAASEAAIGGKPPVIPDPGAKSDFIAAARRAARAAALAAPDRGPTDEAAAPGAPLPKRLTQRLRALIVVAAVVVIVLGTLHIVSRLFMESGGNAPSTVQTEKPLPPPAAPVATNPVPRTTPLVLPSGKPAANPGAPMNVVPALPSPSPDAAPDSRLRRQSRNRTPDSSAVALPRSVAGKAETPSSVPEFTGSLPQASAPAAVTSDDKLPVGIGGPTLRAAALAGNAAAAYEVAVRFANGRGVVRNNEEAAHWFERAAKMGLAPAQFRLGTLYEKGIGVKRDVVAARDLYRAAAEKGNGKAMHNLGVLYAEGADGPADYRSAAHWFREAADHGIFDSQYNLGVLYARGVGVQRNFAESYKWFFLAAEQGDKDAAGKRDEMAAHLDRKSLEAARRAAQEWKAKPQPAAAIMVRIPRAWTMPAAGTSAVKSRDRSNRATAAQPHAMKID